MDVVFGEVVIFFPSYADKSAKLKLLSSYFKGIQSKSIIVSGSQRSDVR